MAMQRMAHPDGELAVARAAAACGVPMVDLKISCDSCSKTHITNTANNDLLVLRVTVSFSYEMALTHCNSPSRRTFFFIPRQVVQLRDEARLLGLATYWATVLVPGLQVQSTMGTVGLKDVCNAGRGAPLMFFQLYVLKDREFSKNIIQGLSMRGPLLQMLY
jgi:isopentenyl diphosphate isomerase/L-lactate dehydrogenase-like FMN-dependent dehydrogenase